MGGLAPILYEPGSRSHISRLIDVDVTARVGHAISVCFCDLVDVCKVKGG